MIFVKCTRYVAAKMKLLVQYSTVQSTYSVQSGMLERINFPQGSQHRKYKGPHLLIPHSLYEEICRPVSGHVQLASSHHLFATECWDRGHHQPDTGTGHSALLALSRQMVLY